MIAYVRGTLVEKTTARAVVEAAGVGYEFAIPLSTYDRLPRTLEEVKLLAYHLVREDAEELFGFLTVRERDFFAQLVSVSGVGPKLALALLSGASLGELALAISAGDFKRLAAIKGVGRKTAEKICVELKDKVNAFEALGSGEAATGGEGEARAFLRDAIQALAALGFAEELATRMVTQALSANPQVADAEALIRLALRQGKA